MNVCDRLTSLAESFQGVHAVRLTSRPARGVLSFLLGGTSEVAAPPDLAGAPLIWDRERGEYRRAEDRPAALWAAVVDRLVDEFGNRLSWGQVKSNQLEGPVHGYVLAWQVRVSLTYTPVMAEQGLKDKIAGECDRWLRTIPHGTMLHRARLYRPGERVVNPKDPDGVYYFGLSYRRPGWTGGRYLCYRETGAKKTRGQKLVALSSIRPYSA